MMYTIGIDPHKRSHTAVAVDEAENEIARRRVIAGPDQLAELTGFASTLDGECRWAIEAATGVGLLLAQQFTRAGIDVVDVPPTLAARHHRYRFDHDPDRIGRVRVQSAPITIRLPHGVVPLGSGTELANWWMVNHATRLCGVSAEGPEVQPQRHDAGRPVRAHNI